MKITPQQRSEVVLQRDKALQLSLSFERSLIKLRTAEVKRIAGLLLKMPIEEWEQGSAQLVDEKYLKAWLTKLYVNIGTPQAKHVASSILSRKSDDIWEQALLEYIRTQAGTKIYELSSTFGKDLSKIVAQYLEANASWGVQQIVNGLYDGMLGGFGSVKEWQVRRIAQTEAMSALNVAGNEAANIIGLPTAKTWCITGKNTRPSHILMDGRTIEMAKPFNVNGSLMMYPHDSSMGAVAGEIVNCGCSVIYRPVDPRFQFDLEF